jgi:hypothetical protein
MPYCYRCGKPWTGIEQYCTNCGAPLLANPELKVPEEVNIGKPLKADRVVPPETISVSPPPALAKRKMTAREIAATLGIIVAAFAISIGIVVSTDPDAFNWLSDLFDDGGGGGGFRSCIIQYFSDAPDCSDGSTRPGLGGDGTPKRTVLNGKEIGVCRYVRNGPPNPTACIP